MVYCKKCGAKLDKDSNFCKTCGSNIGIIKYKRGTNINLANKKRRVEFIFGILGGILGLVATWLIYSKYLFEGDSTLLTMEMAIYLFFGIITSLVGITGAIFLRFNYIKLGSWLMIGSGFIQLMVAITIIGNALPQGYIYHLPSFLLLAIGGLIALLKKNE